MTMAIDELKEKAQLSEEGTTKCTTSDCISRQAAMEHVDDVPYVKEHPDIGLLWKVWLEGLPSVQPERKKGKWIQENIVLTSNPAQYKWDCSECGHVIIGFYGLINRYKFCPNCGAPMMEGEQDETD